MNEQYLGALSPENLPGPVLEERDDRFHVWDVGFFYSIRQCPVFLLERSIVRRCKNPIVVVEGHWRFCVPVLRQKTLELFFDFRSCTIV